MLNVDAQHSMNVNSRHIPIKKNDHIVGENTVRVGVLKKKKQVIQFTFF